MNQEKIKEISILISKMINHENKKIDNNGLSKSEIIQAFGLAFYNSLCELIKTRELSNNDVFSKKYEYELYNLFSFFTFKILNDFSPNFLISTIKFLYKQCRESGNNLLIHEKTILIKCVQNFFQISCLENNNFITNYISQCIDILTD